MKRPVMLKYLLKDPDIGALAATSIYGVQHVCSKINPNNAKIIIEYGPGTGVFTDYILNNFSNSLKKFILIEKNKDFYNYLKNKINDSRVCIVHESAENVLDILHHCGEKNANYIISGIPFSYFEDSLKFKILMNTREALAESGKFLIYQYRRLIYSYLTELFAKVRYEREILNFPPLFICEAIK